VYLCKTCGSPRALAAIPVQAGTIAAMSYKRGILLFTFLLSAYTVYHLSSDTPVVLRKMKRSMVRKIIVAHTCCFSVN
jgi:hypothetical protein